MKPARKPLIVLLTLCTGLCFAEETGDAIPEETRLLTGKYEEAMHRLDVPLFELRDAYLTRLESLKTEIQEQGNLELVLVLTTEMERIVKGGEPGTASPHPPHANLQETYHNHKEKLAARILSRKEDIEEAYLEKIRTRVAEHTRAGELDTALALRGIEEISRKRLERWRSESATYSVGNPLFTRIDWTGLERKVGKAPPGETGRVGGNPQRNETTRDLPDPPALLIGFDLHMAPFGGSEHTVRKMVPLFRSRTESLFEGKPRANANGQSVERVVAKDGYVVTGITTHSGAGVRKVKFEFSRVKGLQVDPEDTYETGFYGIWEDGREATLSTDGKLPVGIDGWVGLGTGEFWLLTVE